MAKQLFSALLRAPKKAYQERNIDLPYKDFRVLLGALDKRERPEGVVLAWGLRNSHGMKAYLRLTKPHDHVRIELSVPEMVSMAHRDPQELYAYLHTCTELLKCQRPSE